MPDNQRKCRGDYSGFDSMTTEELEEILRRDAQNLEGENTDVDMLKYITEVIRKRKGPDPNRKTAEEAFEIFKTKYFPNVISEEAECPAENTADNAAGTDEAMPAEYIRSGPDQRPDNGKEIVMPRWLRRLASAAAVIAVVVAGGITVNALGYHLREIVVQWTRETFHFSVENSPVTNAPAVCDQREFSSLREALLADKITTPLVPTWLPEGYEFADLRISDSPSQKVFLAVYQCGDALLKIQVKQSNSELQQIEQSASLAEMYVSDGVEYYIFKNGACLQAAWVKDNFECYISGELSIQEIKKMIDSIVKEE